MKYKHTTIKDFNALKALQEVGMDQRAAGEAIGKSYDTARRVYKSKSWEDYRENLSEINEKYGKKKTPVLPRRNLRNHFHCLTDTLVYQTHPWKPTY